MWSFFVFVSWGTSYFKSFNTLSTKEFITEDILIQEHGGGGAIPWIQLYQKAENQGISKKYYGPQRKDWMWK